MDKVIAFLSLVAIFVGVVVGIWSIILVALDMAHDADLADRPWFKSSPVSGEKTNGTSDQN